MKKILEISSNETISVRHSVLRSGKPVETCFFEGDDLPTTKHFGLSINEKIIAIVSVFKNNNSNFKHQNQYQIRGMAVLDEHQKNGYGRELMLHCERFFENQNAEVIWFNARQNAVDFYSKLGYLTHGNSFEIKGVGEHYLMKKELF